MRMRVEPCLMMEKIEWYQEVLKLDPDSKVFFPLAKLLRDSQQPDKAIQVLRAGLQHSSVFLEARLLLIQILFEQSRAGECSEELSTVTGLLERYPAFWEEKQGSGIGHPADGLDYTPPGTFSESDFREWFGYIAGRTPQFFLFPIYRGFGFRAPMRRFPRRNALHGYALRAGTIFLYGTR